MKKLPFYMLSAALTALSCSQAYAAPFCGFYGGISGGGSFLSGTEHINVNRSVADGDDLTGSFALQDVHGIKNNSLIGMAFLGYGNTFCSNAYLGGEIFIDWTNHNPTTSQFVGATNTTDSSIPFSYYSRVKIQPVSWGIDLRPGYQIAECSLLYARVGVGVKRFTQYINASEVFDSEGDLTPINSSFSGGKTRAVLRLGLGFEQALTEDLSFRADYIYTYLGRHNAASGVFNGAVELDDVDRVVSSNVSSSKQLYTNTFLLGLCWHW